MPSAPKYKRVILKVSGEAMCCPGAFGIEAPAVSTLVREIVSVTKIGVQVGLVVGGGNFIRGRDLAGPDRAGDIHRVTADHMGMLATVINALALRDALELHRVPAIVLSAIPMPQVCAAFARREAVKHLEDDHVVIFAAGTGSPFFTTDMCAALRAGEIDAEALLKGTKVDGVFEADPAVNPKAKKFDRLTYDEVLARRLGVMDLTAILMCMERKIPIVVFELARPGNLLRAVKGEAVGTIITE